MTGGDGSDYYYVRDSGDLVSETNAVAATGGTDTVYSYLSTYTLGDQRRERTHPQHRGPPTSPATPSTTSSTPGPATTAWMAAPAPTPSAYAYGLSGTTGVTVSLALATAQATGGSGTDTLISIENLTGIELRRQARSPATA
jgi:hypothetical protein